MRHAWLLAALIVVPGVLSGQAPGVLRVTVTLRDGQTPTPVPRHALLISDNPATAGPKRVLTRADGTVEVTLAPGLYTVESDRPVMFLGRAYQWTEMVDVVTGRDVVLRLSSDNAEVVAANAATTPTASPAPSDSDPSFLLARWAQSVVAVWSPTTRATGAVVDASGLVATVARGLETGPVSVQVSEALKVPAAVVASDAASGVAILRVHPTAVSGRPPIPVDCPPARPAALDDGDELVAIVAPLRGAPDSAWGAVTGFSARAIDADLRLGFGGAGAPVFRADGVVAGLAVERPEADGRARGDVAVARAVFLCGLLSAARAKLDVAPPEAVRLPVEPARPFPEDALRKASQDRPGPVMPLTSSSEDFDIAFITPPMVYRAQQRADRTGGPATRDAQAEAMLGALTEFGVWSPYFEDTPPVLVVRVTPKLVEGFWKRLAREALRTQGAVLPPLKDFKANFGRLEASCGRDLVTPIHPLVLEHRVGERDVVREGLYVFDAGALTPECGGVTLTIYSEKTPAEGQAVAVDSKVLEQLRQDLGTGTKSPKM